jgi:uncharacterized RDD family membrane protein YckC
MRCPKCHYISFEGGDRCRNCGYEFSLSVDVAALDLPIQTGDEPIGPLADFALTDLDTSKPAPPHENSKPRTPAGLDLPLFKDRTPDDDRPLVTTAVPRAPLAVRKSSPIAARPSPRPRVEEPELDLGPVQPEVDSAPDVSPSAPRTIESATIAAPLGRRVAAFAIDAALLGLVDLSVLYFTLRLCGLQFAEIGLISPVPFVSFVLLQNGGYFAALVALGGQTIGKMALDIKVVPADATDAWSDRVPLGVSALRAALWILTVLPAGIGLVPALFSADRRTVHDRLAGTRVVKA